MNLHQLAHFVAIARRRNFTGAARRIGARRSCTLTFSRLRTMLDTNPDRFVLLVSQSPEESFVVSGKQQLPPLERITPAF